MASRNKKEIIPQKRLAVSQEITNFAADIYHMGSVPL